MPSKVENQKLKGESRRSKLWLCAVWLLLLTFNFRLSTGFPQQPQAQAGQPIYPINAKYVQGFGPGYWPTAGSQLTLNLAPGTAVCRNTVQTYTGGTLTLTASTTNYVYLDAANNCTPASNTTGFSSTSIPIARVTTEATAITSITDVRTMFVANESGAVTSVGMTGDGVIFNTAVQGSPITTSGTLIPQLLTQTANRILAGPSSGSAAAPAFRSLVGADLPTPSANALGGVKSLTCGSGQFVNQISTSGLPACATPSGGGGGNPDGLGNGTTVIDATTMTGGDAEAQIAAALAALPSLGGVVDGRGFTGSQTWGATLVVTKPLKLLLGNATFTFSGPGPMILVNGVQAEIEGTTNTHLVTSSNDDAIRSTTGINLGGLILKNLGIQDALGSGRTKGAAVNVDPGDQATSTRFDCLDVYVSGFMFGFREILPINSHFIGCEALGALLDDFRIEGGTSTSFISTFANSANRDGYALTSRYAPSQLLDPQPVTLTVNSPGTGTLPAGTYPFQCSALDGNGGETQAMGQSPIGSASITLGQTITITCQPVHYNQWQASTTYAQNQIVVPNPANGHRYISITTGTAVSGSSQPSFCTSTHCTVTDGAITWQENGTSNVAYNIYMPGYDSVSQAYDVQPFRLIATTSPGTNSYTISAPPTFQQSGGNPIYQPQTNTTGIEFMGGLGYSDLIATAADITRHTAYSLVRCISVNLVGVGAEANSGLGAYLFGSNQIKFDSPNMSAHEGGIWIDVPHNSPNVGANDISIVHPSIGGFGDPGSWGILNRLAGVSYSFGQVVDGGVLNGFGANGYGGNVSGVSAVLHQGTEAGEEWSAEVSQVFGQQTPIYNANNQVSVLSVVSKDNNGTRWPLAIGVQGSATPAAVITSPSDGKPVGFLYAVASGHSGQHALQVGGGSYASPGTLSIPGDIYAGGPGPYVFKGPMSVGSGAGNPPSGVTVNAVGGYVSSDTGFCIGSSCVTSLTQGTVTSVGLSMPAVFSVSGSPVTSSGTLTASWVAQNANLVFAGPSSGSAVAPTFRTLVGADLPTPTATTLGGIESLTCASNTWLSQISTGGVPSCSQPGFSNLSGAISLSQTPLTTAGDLLIANGTPALARLAVGTAHQYLGNSSGLPAWVQPAFSDISGTVAASQLPTPTTSTLGGIESITSSSHNWVSHIDTSGVPHQSQPAFSDISGTISGSQFGSQSANQVFASPNGTSGNPVFRALVGADLPTPTVSALGGLKALASATSHNWVQYVDTSGAQQLSQPGFGDLSGTIASSQYGSQTANYVLAAPNGSSGNPTFRALVGADLPNPSASTLGGVESITSASHNWVSYIDTSGVPHQSQPTLSDLTATFNSPLSLSINTLSCTNCVTGSSLTSGQLVTGNAGSAIQVGNLSGDVTTSGGTVTVVGKVNGVAYPASPSTNQVPVVTGANTITYEAVPNAALANSSVTLNGQAVSLGSSGNVNSGATAHSVALNQSAGSAITGVTLGAHQTLVGAASADPSPKTIPDCQDSSGNHLNYTQSSDAFGCGTSVATHAMLSAIHSDTTAGTVVTGDVITGQSSKWARLAGNALTTKYYLQSYGNGSTPNAPAWAQVAWGDLSGVPSSFTPSAHNLLSSYHGDTTSGTVARGDLITGQGASPTWARLAKGTAAQCLQMNGTATDIVWGACGSGGGANLTLSNLTSPTAINLSTLTFAGAARNHGGGNESERDAHAQRNRTCEPGRNCSSQHHSEPWNVFNRHHLSWCRTRDQGHYRTGQ